ncbi:hypothetical protein RclHR1_06720009 [Rhizophagus clarus]|uniref:Uncharacterized protein n=1 Tax=Rhizophagus clarus TaxID=94130 RepID=A0A2Z6RZE5_9GLOM|nr:hypothetical protein RclHR1_06720009 [Rhizophagus clarus]
MSFEISNKKDKSHHNYRYSFNISLPLYKTAYLKLCNLNDYKLLTLQNHYQENRLTERIHENTGHASRRNSKVFVNFNITSSIKQYLTQYGIINGLPSPMRHQNDSGNFIYLPTDENYTIVYNKYKENFYLEHNDEDEKIIFYSTFHRIWQETIPTLKFQPPASDICETCNDFKSQMRIAKSNLDQYNIIKNQYDEHQKKADLKRQHYNNNIEQSKHDLPIPPTYSICYDWTQNVTIPYSPQQVGSIYFKSTFAVHLFGVCKTEDGLSRQINFIIAENEFPKGVSKGANTTLNMVYHVIKIFAEDEKKDLCITYDNCIAQNKNNLSLFFLVLAKHVSSLPQDIGKVYCSEESGGAEICHKLLRNNNFDVNEKLDILDIVNISEERKKYLHKKIRQHIEDPYKDIYYL